MSNVRLERLVKRFGNVEVIAGVDLDIAPGEFIVFVGPSGCGKSTLLRLIAGLEEATSGSIWMAGRDVTRLPPAERSVSMVFQSYALYPHMDAYQNIAFGLRIPKTSADTLHQRVRRVAEKLQIEGILNRRPRELSGGQRQRVAIARAIAREPNVFLFDEPLSNLDAALRSQTRVEIARLHDELPSTMIYVTHDQQEAMTLADRIVLLNGGRIEQIATPTKMYQQPATRFAAEFIGSPAMNILPATLEAGRAVLRTGEEIPLDVSFSGPADIGIRPESLSLSTSQGQGALHVRVIHIEDLGDSRLLHAALADGKYITARCNAETSLPAKGESATLRADPARLHLFNADGTRIA